MVVGGGRWREGGERGERWGGGGEMGWLLRRPRDEVGDEESGVRHRGSSMGSGGAAFDAAPNAERNGVPSVEARDAQQIKSFATKST